MYALSTLAFFLSLETTTGRQGSLGVPSKWISFLESLGLSAFCSLGLKALPSGWVSLRKGF